MAFTISPNMNLRVPTVGNEPGPDYAIDINFDLASVLDAHDHSPGRGVQITPNGININIDLPFGNNFATAVGGVTFTAQSSTPALGTIYESGVDLFYVDGLGNNIRMTQSGGVAGSPGSITNLTPPASVNYVSGSQTFVFQSGVGIAANIDAGAYLFRNLSPDSTFAITLQAPALLASNYSLTLPLLPSQNSFMALDQFGQMTASIPIANGLTTSNISASANILGTQLSPSANILGSQLSASAGILSTQLASPNNITNAQISASAAIAASKINGHVIEQTQTFTSGGTFVTPANAIVTQISGCGGGEGGSQRNNNGTAPGGWGAPWTNGSFDMPASKTLTIVIGTGGLGGPSANTNGSPGVASTVSANGIVFFSAPGADSVNSIGYVANSPFFNKGTDAVFNSAHATGAGAGPYGAGTNGIAGSNNFSGANGVANTGAGGGSASAQTTVVGTAGRGGSGRIIITYLIFG